MWSSSEIPARWRRSARTWLSKNKDFAYCLWTDPELDRFVSAEYAWLAATHRGYRYPIQRCDAARYMLLYRYGGVYVDLDVACRQPLSSLFEEAPPAAGIVLTAAVASGYAPDFIAVRRPRDPVVRGILSGLRRAADSWWYPPLPYTAVLFRTGPVYFTRRVDCHDRPDDVHLIPASKHRDYVGYVGGASWHSWDGWLIWNAFLLRYHLLWSTIALFCVALLARVFRRRRAIASYWRK